MGGIPIISVLIEVIVSTIILEYFINLLLLKTHK